MAAVFHDLLDVRRQGRAAAVDFYPDFDVRIRRCFAAGNQGLADLLKSLFYRHTLRQIIGPHLHATAADVRRELDEGLAGVDVLLHDGRIRGMKFADRAAAPDFNARVGEAPAHFLALLLVQGRLHAVRMRGAQLDRRDADRLAHPQNGRHIPLGGDVVGHHAETEFERLCLFFRRGQRC